MSQAISTYQVLDDRLAVSDSINFGVAVGAQSINQQTFASQTASPSQVSINALIPSLQTVIDRHLVVRSTIQLTITGTLAAAGNFLLNYPTNFALSPFPFSQLVNTMSCQINNTTVNSNYADNLATMLRQMTPDGLAKYSDTCPTQLDTYQQFATTGTLSPFQNILNANDTKVLPRGAWILDSIVGNTAAALGDLNRSVVITFTTTEPIFCSPFLFGDVMDEHNSGLSGVSSLNFNFNLGNVGRMFGWKPANANDALTGASVAFTKCELLATFLSPKPSQLIPLTCSLPYYELNTYRSAFNTGEAAGSDIIVQSSIISPNCIPDKVYIQVRPQDEATTQGRALRPNYRFPISNVSITWNTQSGMMASATIQDLYEMSKRAGLKQTYLEFIGVAGGSGTGDSGASAAVRLSGGIICLNFNEMLPIMEQYYSSSSLGQWTFSVAVKIRNTLTTAIPPYELLTTFFQSGVFQSTSGSSSQYVGVLSKDEVLRVAQEAPTVQSQHYRMIGGAIPSWLSSAIKSSSGKLLDFGKDMLLPAAAKVAKEELRKGDSKLGHIASAGLGALGYGRPRVR